MKKITNKIFWITAIAAILIIVLGITIPFQTYYRKNPPQSVQDTSGYQLILSPDVVDTLESITEIEEDSNL